MTVPLRQADASESHLLAHMLFAFNTEFEEETPAVEELDRGIRRLIEADEAVFLLVADPPAGFAQLRFRTVTWSTGLTCYLEELYVRPDERGKGFGRTLLDECLRVAREHGAVHIELNTSETDEAARGLYEATGFTNYDAGGAQMLYYEREL